jgi:tetratricopeptide (TPR) repeat protein
MKIEAILAVAFGLCLIARGPLLADGGGGDGGGGGRSDPTTCQRGEAWDSRSGKCVKAERGVLPDEALTDYAFALIKAGRYDEALSMLDLLTNPNTPVALNYRGYATRKQGRLDEGIGYYLKSVALDPHYAQVREYLGEAYLLKGDMVAAKAQLQAIKQICGSICEEYQHLAVAIADPTYL